MASKSKIAVIFTVVIIAAVIFFVLRGMRTIHSGVISDPKGFLNALYPWLSAEAGGLSDRNTGGDRDLHRAQITVTRNGHTYVNPHTNRDVTYTTFLKYARKFGYPATPQGFVDMPEWLWREIVNAIYVGDGLPYTNNLVLAAYIGSWYWGSGSISSTNKAKIRAILKKPIGDGDKLDQLIALRKQFFASLHSSNPTKFPQSLVDSYDERADSFREHFYSYAA